MAKNDVVVRTAADLERKYNFAALLGLKENVEKTNQGMQKIENELNNMLNALVINLKGVLDNQREISLWFYSGIPTTSNLPYTSWENPSEHIGDIYYDQSSGYVYQWNGVWQVNVNPDLIEAMAITNAETDTTTDHERKVYFDTPKPPYSNGDWWIKEDGSLFICQISKKTGTYETIDFIDSSNYVESVVEKIGEEIKVLKGSITIISENYAKFTDLATGGSTTIAGENITTGNIESNNYKKDVSGTKIALEDGTIDTKNFKVDSNGNIKSTGGDIGGFSIGQHELTTNLTMNHQYTQDDVTKVQNTMAGTYTPTAEELDYLDVDGDGRITISDLLIINKIVLGALAATGSFQINTQTSNKALRLYKSDGSLGSSLSIFGGYFHSLGADSIRAESVNSTQVNAGNMDCGRCTLTANGDRTIYFNKKFPVAPNVVITPITTTGGVIAPKITAITTDYFLATIGGTSFGDNEFCWIAMY